jgi:hypothetical protein
MVLKALSTLSPHGGIGREHHVAMLCQIVAKELSFVAFALLFEKHMI